MDTIVKPVYYCEHCRKHMLAKGHMVKHEKYCKMNPANKHKCFEYCEHLVQSQEDYNAGSDWVDGVGEVDIYMKRRVFTCALLQKKMYSYIAEKKDIVKHMTDATRMPLECEHFKDPNGLDF